MGSEVIGLISQGHSVGSGIVGNIVLLAQAEEPPSAMKKLTYDGGPPREAVARPAYGEVVFARLMGTAGPVDKPAPR